MAFGDILFTTAVDSDAGDPISATLSGSRTAGNLLVYWVFTFASNSTAGTGLSEAYENIHSGNGDVAALYYRVIQGGDGNTWEVDLAESDQYAAILSEIEGQFATAPLDQTGESEVTANNNVVVSASGATTQADELAVVCFGVRDAVNTVDITALSDSFTGLLTEHNALGQAWHMLVARGVKVLSATGTPSCQATLSSANASIQTTNCIATFKKAAAVGSTAAHGVSKSDQQAIVQPSMAGFAA